MKIYALVIVFVLSTIPSVAEEFSINQETLQEINEALEAHKQHYQARKTIKELQDILEEYRKPEPKQKPFKSLMAIELAHRLLKETEEIV
ncbi:MAG: hypothetical protein OXD33_08275 [Rhodobacteraceae bacterium]|nr:hypothetical protein [Paracoccaceae bacterium]